MANVVISLLSDGILKHASGVPATATPWTDYAPGLPTAAAGGTVDVITATYAPAVTLTNGTRVILVAAGANTGAVTFAPNALTAKAIVKYASTTLVAGDIPSAAYECDLIYNGTAWVLQNPSLETRLGGASAPSATELGYVKGLTSTAQTQLDAKAASTLDAVLADGEWDGTSENILLGATVTAGQALEPYDDSGTIKYKPAVKTSTVGATHLALAAGDAGDTIAGLLAGRHRLDAVYNFAAGNQLWRDLTTDGAITATQPTAEGDVMQFLGYRRSDHIIFWNPAPLPMTLGVQP